MPNTTIRLIAIDTSKPGMPEIDRVKIADDGDYNLGRSEANDIVLAGDMVSRHHVIITKTGAHLTVNDLGSANGTYIDDFEVATRAWNEGEKLKIGQFVLTYEKVAGEAQPATPKPEVMAPTPQPTARPDFPGALFDAQLVPVAQIKASPAFAGECDYLAVGSGIGSFTWIDHLRIFGVATSQIRTIGVNTAPYSKYKLLCRNSQIPNHERLRSNSASTPDNIWGFPGYASRETWRELKKGNLGGLNYIFQVFGEPTLKESYTPRAGDVYDSFEREQARIGWPEMLISGRVIAIRKTDDGRYVVAYRLRADRTDGPREQLFIGRYLHLATGYPASRYLPDLQKFKDRHPGANNVINAYASHDGVYTDLAQNGGTVIVRGRGIVASRVIQRLYEVRQQGADVQFYHLMRSRISQQNSARYDLSRRVAAHDIEYQPFNWPKSAWGGTLRKRLEQATPEERGKLMRAWGGTTTADRADWDQILTTGKREGWIKPYFGEVTEMKLDGKKIKCRIKSRIAEGEEINVDADYIIDCTGLIADLTHSPLLADVIEKYNIARNKIPGNSAEINLSGLAVTNDFEIPELANGPGRAYAAGVLTTNGPYAGVDSFLGLQYAALRSVDHLNRVGAPGISNFGPFKSFGQWLKWCSNSAP